MVQIDESTRRSDRSMTDDDSQAAMHQLPMEDLSAAATRRDLEQYVDIHNPAGESIVRSMEDVFERIARILFRRENNHVLITGNKGVGKTTVVRELARRAAIGEMSVLNSKRIVRLDCSAIVAEDSRGFLEGMFAAVGTQHGLVLCLDGLANVIGGRFGGDNKKLLRAGSGTFANPSDRDFISVGVQRADFRRCRNARNVYPDRD